MTPFDPTNVLPDKALFGYNPAFDVQKFFVDRGSFLASREWTAGASTVPLSLWISKFCRDNDVKAEWVCVRLQAEQGLIETTPGEAMTYATTPKSWKEVDATGALVPMTTFDPTLGTLLDYKLRWALGFSAFEGGFKPVLNGIQMAGIGNQCQRMIEWTRRAFNNTAHGIPSQQVDGQPLIAKTRATYAIYRYTPHVSAAKETAAVFAKYFPSLTYQS